MNVLQNPELIRNVRERLRQKHLIVGIAIVVSMAVIFGAWGVEKERHQYDITAPLNGHTMGLNIFAAFLIISFILMYLINTYCCAQAVSSEKIDRTYDFQLMTRLTPVELLVGKLFGAPIIGYVLIGIFALFSAGSLIFLGGVSLKTFVIAYLLLITSGIALNAIALLISTYVEKMWVLAFVIGGLLIVSQFFGLLYGGVEGSGGYVRGISVLDPFTTISNSEVGTLSYTNVFGIELPALLAQTAFYILIAVVACYVITLRIKQTRQRMMKYHILWIAMFLQLVILSLLWPPVFNTLSGQSGVYHLLELQYGHVDYFKTFAIFLALSTVLIFLIALGFIGSWHDLNIWLRKQFSGLIDGVAWWLDEKALPTFGAITLGISALAIFVISYLLFSSSNLLQGGTGTFTLMSSLFILFIIRDVSFLSGMRLTKFGRNLWMPLLFLSLFYLIGSVLSAIFLSDSQVLISTFFPLTHLLDYQGLAVSRFAWYAVVIVGIEALLMALFHYFTLRYARKKALALAKTT